MNAKKFKLYWSPTGAVIGIVTAKSASEARRKAPQPYRKYLGEIATEELTWADSLSVCPKCGCLGNSDHVRNCNIVR